MEKKYTWTTTVAYADVDRHERLSLPGLFKLLQEVAIKHANQFDIGTRTMAARGESWVLNRITAEVLEYARHEDELLIESWSSGITGFRGFREYRVYRGGQLLATASSLWLYVNTSSKTLVRVPQQVADQFPSVADSVAHPGFDRVPVPELTAVAAASKCDVSVRYSDFDANDHVNNTAYLEFLQTALVRAGLSPAPRHIQLKFSKEIPPETEYVTVALARETERVVFNIGRDAAVFAQGTVA